MLVTNIANLVRGQTANGTVAWTKQLNNVQFGSAIHQSEEMLRVSQTNYVCINKKQHIIFIYRPTYRGICLEMLDNNRAIRDFE